MIVRSGTSRRTPLTARAAVVAISAMIAVLVLAGPATAAQPARAPAPAAPALATPAPAAAGAAPAAAAPAPAAAGAPPAAAPAAAGRAARAAVADCSPGQSGAAVPTPSSGRAAVRTTIGVAKSMGVSVKGQIIAVMVMYQESSIRNLANDATSTQNASWPSPGRPYWMNVTKLSLKYPHDTFGSRDGAHDTDSIGLYQQRPAYGWGNYGNSTGTTDPEGVVQRLLDPRWEAMAFFGGTSSAAPTSGLLDVAGWENMAPTYAANAVQGSNFPEYYAQWEGPATTYVNANQDAPAIALPWYPGGGGGALACTSIPTDPARGEAGRNPLGNLDGATVDAAGIRLSGWMLDPDAANGIGQIHFYDQGPFGTAGYPTGVATELRDDVNRAYNVLGQYGFVTMLPRAGAGLHTICAYGINVGRGTGNPQLGCLEVTVPGPTGSVDMVRANASAQIEINGWAADPGAPGATEQVHVYVTGALGTAGTAGTFTGDSRPDVATAMGWTGGNQGFHATVPGMGRGDNQVCVYAINVNPPRNNPPIGCRSVTVLADPIGYFDGLSVAGNRAQVSGWTLDPNAPSVSTAVHIYVTSSSGQVTGTGFRADDPRPDVNAAYAVTGNHGFSRSVPLYPGTNSVCVYAITTTPGADNPLLGCRTAQAGSTARLLAVPDAGTSATAPAAPTDAAMTSSAPPGSATTTTAPSTAPSTDPSAAPSSTSRLSMTASSAAPTATAPAPPSGGRTSAGGAP